MLIYFWFLRPFISCLFECWHVSWGGGGCGGVKNYPYMFTLKDQFHIDKKISCSMILLYMNSNWIVQWTQKHQLRLDWSSTSKFINHKGHKPSATRGLQWNDNSNNNNTNKLTGGTSQKRPWNPVETRNLRHGTIALESLVSGTIWVKEGSMALVE